MPYPLSNTRTTAIPSPFSDPTFIAGMAADKKRRGRLERAIARDVRQLVATTTAPLSTATAVRPTSILAYRLIIRSLTFARNCASDWHEETLGHSLRRMVRRVEQGADRLTALRAHVGTVIELAYGSEAAQVIPALWQALAPAAQDLVDRHWCKAVEVAASRSNKYGVSHYRNDLRQVRHLRVLLTSATAVA